MKRVGLALGSGDARGWAHIGVIRALQEDGIGIQAIAGASIGALVGAVHCAGELDELEDFVRDLRWRDLLSYFDMVVPTSGLLDGNRVYELLSEHMQAMRIEESAIPFCCVATDLIQAAEVHLRAGCMVDAVRASIAVPVDVVRDLGAEVVIAVNLNHNAVTGGLVHTDQPAAGAPSEADGVGEEAAPGGRLGPGPSEAAQQRRASFLRSLQDRFESLQHGLHDKVDRWLSEEEPEPNIFEVIGTSLNVTEQQVTRGRLKMHKPDLLVEPQLHGFAIFDFHQAERIIALGHRAMRAQLPALRELL